MRSFPPSREFTITFVTTDMEITKEDLEDALESGIKWGYDLPYLKYEIMVEEVK